MNEDLQQLLENLKLKTIAVRFEEMLAAAEGSGTPVPDALCVAVQAPGGAASAQADAGDYEPSISCVARLPGNPALTKALLSRLRERCHTITLDGPCSRPQTG